MDSFYEELEWEINVKFDVQPEFISVSTEYLFGNSSEEKIYYAILPRFQSIPYHSLTGENKTVWIEAQIIDRNKNKEVLFAGERRVEGIDAQSDCYMPIPWPSLDRFISPGNLLKLRFFWTEQGPSRVTIEGGHKRWTINHCLPLSKLFLPFEISGKNAPANIVVLYESITWEINFPEGTSFTGEPNFESFKPSQRNLIPNTSHVTASQPKIRFSITPNDKPFSDHKFTLSVNLAVPIELENELFQAALQNIREYTSEVIVAVVDLRGSSDMAESQRDKAIPVDYTLRFHSIARELFPRSLFSEYSDDPLKLSMKKVVGDMLMLVAPVSKSVEVAKAIIGFLRKLADEKMPFRAGFHVDQATSTGNFMYSFNEIGIDFLGPALNWAAKIGDDKKNLGIRVTKPAADRILPLLGSIYELVQVDSFERRPDLEIFDLREKSPEVYVSQPKDLTPFSDRLSQRAMKLNSRVCVGLDPDLTYFPKQLLTKYDLVDLLNNDFNQLPLHDVAECIVEFNKMVIDAVCGDAVAVKPQSAHYERFAHYGIKALEETARYAREKGLIVILDAKRNDIGSTAEKYALAYIGSDHGKNAAAIPFDAITINPYLGSDGIKPFIESCTQNGKGIFILVKTSNTSSGDLQDLPVTGDNGLLSHHVASMVNNWGKDIIDEQGYSPVGAVVGATYPEDIIVLREKMPNSIFLMPGYGAQGAKAENIASAFDEKGLGAIINSSRGIIYPCSPDATNFQDKIKEQVISMKNDINRYITDK